MNPDIIAHYEATGYSPFFKAAEPDTQKIYQLAEHILTEAFCDEDGNETLTATDNYAEWQGLTQDEAWPLAVELAKEKLR